MSSEALFGLGLIKRGASAEDGKATSSAKKPGMIAIWSARSPSVLAFGVGPPPQVIVWDALEHVPSRFGFLFQFLQQTIDYCHGFFSS